MNLCPPLLAFGLLAASIHVQVALAADACVARTAADAPPPTVVELYTSEGCSSCPPADRWASTLKGRPDVLALAVHVDYWDKLGWADRFATREATARQYELANIAGRAQVYTPQVRVDGRDWRNWPRLPAADKATGAPVVALQREGDIVTAQVAAGTGVARWSGYWAVLEDNHQSRVRAGENAGETLKHDGVVRLYRPVAAWKASDGLRAQLQVSRGVPEFPRRVVFVVTDAASAKPLQALALAPGC